MRYGEWGAKGVKTLCRAPLYLGVGNQVTKTRGRGSEASDCCLWGKMGWQVGRKQELVVRRGSCEILFIKLTQ